MIRRLLAKALKNRTYVLLLALLISCTSSLAGAHVHDLEKSSGPSAFELAEDCALCHASHGFTFEAKLPYLQVFLDRYVACTGRASTVRLGYSYLPESRAPPTIS